MGRARRSKLWATAFVFFMVLAVFSIGGSVAVGKTIYVDDDGPADFNNIQAAINDANDGDTVEIQPGTYRENIHLRGKNIAVRSVEPSNPETVANTVINGSGLGPVVTFAGTENGDCQLNGFTITGGNSAEPEHGGGVQGNATGAAISYCVIRGNSSYRRGGGLFDFDGPITNCVITQNSPYSAATTEGGGLHSCDGPITGCTISYNTSGRGGGLYDCDGTIRSCTITDNFAGGNGGGLHGCDGLIVDCNIVGNAARSHNFSSQGGGLYGCSGRISDCSVIGNFATEGGGGFFACSGGISDCLVKSNMTELWGGGGLGFCRSVSNCIITGNSAGSDGGGLDDCSSIVNCLIVNNVAGVNGGALANCGEVVNCTVASNNANGKGGGTYLRGGYRLQGPEHAGLSNCILWNNNAPEGAQICLEPYIVRSMFGDREYPSVIDVQFSDVEGGLAGVSAMDCIVNWSPGNIDSDPCFADLGYWDPNGTPADANDDFFVPGDYHLKSQGGRYDLGTQSWVYDEVTSPCIDAGNPLSPIGAEPFPNGGVVNMGAYGATEEASKSYFDKPPCEIIVAGDVNGDCVVDFLDFRLMALHWCEDNSP